MAQHFQTRRQRTGIFSVTAAAFLLVLLVIPVLAWIHLAHFCGFRLVVGYLLAISTLTFFLYWRDKRSAKANAWRTPESTLHFVELFGGWHAAFIAQRAFRHKISKRSYQTTFWMIGTVQQAVFFDFLNDWQYSQSAVSFLL